MDDAERDDAERDDAERDDAERDDAERDDVERDDVERDDVERDDAERDESVDRGSAPVTGAIPLPRRGPRQSLIVHARNRLYRDDGLGEARETWADVAQRERSAALLQAVSARRRGAPDEGSGMDSDDARVDLPIAPEARRSPEQSADTDVPAPTATGPGSTSESRSEPDRPSAASALVERCGRRRAVALVALLIAFVAGTGAGLLLAPEGDVAAAAATPSRPTLAGDVVRATDGATVTVLVDGRPVEVAILGLAPQAPADLTLPTPCGADTATEFARDNLVGQRVTLVPDPVGAEFDGAGRRYAYVVLTTQQNYTDLALLEGIARWDTGRAFTYGEVFAREEASARSSSAGIWGAPCRTRV